MATVNGEAGFTQLTKLNLTEELWLRGVPVSAGLSGLFTGIGIIGGDINTRDGFYSSGDNKSLLVTGKSIWVNESGTIFAYEWTGAPNPPIYDVDDWTGMSVGVVPASLVLGGLIVSQSGDLLGILSAITGNSYTAVQRRYDAATGTYPLTTEEWSPFELIEDVPLTGTRINLFNNYDASGSPGPGINAYQGSLTLFAYTEMVNFGLHGHTGSLDGPLVATVSDFNSGPILEFDIDNISNGNPAVVTATGHPLVNGDRIGTNFVGGMVEINGQVTTVQNVVAGVSYELVGIDSTAFTPYTTGGKGGGQLVEIPFDNLAIAKTGITGFTQLFMDQDFEADGQFIGQDLPWQRIRGYNVLSTPLILTDAPSDGIKYGRKDAAWVEIPESTGTDTVSGDDALLDTGFKSVGRFSLNTTSNQISDITAYYKKNTAINSTIDIRVIYNNLFDNTDPLNGERYFEDAIMTTETGVWALDLSTTPTPIPIQSTVFFEVQTREIGAGFTYYSGTTINYGEV